MELFNSLLIGILVFIVLLGPLMFVHELGHFLFAKRAGVRVEEFGMGFPPRAVTLFKRGETIYTLNWLPIGAFVRMTGEEDPSDPRSLAAQPKRWRFAVLFAGPAFNFIFAVLVLFVAYLLFATQPTVGRYRITGVTPGSPAQAIGLLPGDEVLSVNGIDATEQLASNLPQDTFILKSQAQASIGKSIQIVVLRPSGDAGEPPAEVTLSGVIPADANPNAPLGVSLGLNVIATERVHYSVPEAFAMALDDLYLATSNLVRAPVELVTGRIAPEMARPVGVVGITSIGVSLLEQGLFPFVRFAGILSMLIGLTNLLPIPALDGGRILFVLIEWVRGRRIDPRREQWTHAVGMILLLTLSAIIIAFDILVPVRLP
ncbi:MAG: M50 family metallopeptidase [Anaerolineae bacterium]|nr:M50 family metallopeptidase [Thermoflexales bacterium]MDW8406524.1 M50 family metallopeptidase [Anaerolineae bacterium]